MGPRRWTALAVLALVAPIAVAQEAGGHGGGPLAYIACPNTATACKEKGKITTPAHGTGVQSTDVVPTGSTAGDIFTTPFTNDEVKTFDALWEAVPERYPSLANVKNVFVRRILTCAFIGRAVGRIGSGVRVEADEDNEDVANAFAQLCVQTVYATYLAEAEPSARVASGGCGVGHVSIPVEIKRSGRKYIAQINALTQKASGRSPLIVSCRQRGPGLDIGLRPRTRERKLYQVLGAHMTIGFANKGNTPVQVQTVFAFR
jgi:hypothetical protein